MLEAMNRNKWRNAGLVILAIVTLLIVAYTLTIPTGDMFRNPFGYRF